MGYCSDFGLRIQFSFNAKEGKKGYWNVLKDLFDEFILDKQLAEKLEKYDYSFDKLFNFERKELQKYIGANFYIFIDIKGYETKFYSDYRYPGIWIKEFICWLQNNKPKINFHFVRIGDDIDDIEEIYTDNILWWLSIKREIEFN